MTDKKYPPLPSIDAITGPADWPTRVKEKERDNAAAAARREFESMMHAYADAAIQIAHSVERDRLKKEGWLSPDDAEKQRKDAERWRFLMANEDDFSVSVREGNLGWNHDLCSNDIRIKVDAAQEASK